LDAKYLGKNGGSLGGDGNSMLMGGARWWGLYKSSSVVTHSLKPPGFNPRAYEVKTWFQSLLFQMQLVPSTRWVRYHHTKLANAVFTVWSCTS
jgi:hypothetical protein